MKIRATASAIPRHRFPVEPWRLAETEPDASDLGLTATLTDAKPRADGDGG